MALHEATALVHKTAEQPWPPRRPLSARTRTWTWMSRSAGLLALAAPAAAHWPANHAWSLSSPHPAENPPPAQGDDPRGARHLRGGADLQAGEAEAGIGDPPQPGGAPAADPRGSAPLPLPPTCHGQGAGGGGGALLLTRAPPLLLPSLPGRREGGHRAGDAELPGGGARPAPPLPPALGHL